MEFLDSQDGFSASDHLANRVYRGIVEKCQAAIHSSAHPEPTTVKVKHLERQSDPVEPTTIRVVGS